MERRLDLRTGESVEIRYELAGLGSRFLAVALDVAIQLGCTIALLGGLALLMGPVASAGGHVPLPLPAGKMALAVGQALVVGVIFILYIGYFIVFELWWSGRTPGKRALGLRVVRDAGFPIDPGAAIVRNLVRILEFGLAFYAVSAISALLSPQNKRLGDLAAGTIVIRDRTVAAATLDVFLASDRPFDDGLDADDRGLVERFVARRDQLEPAARRRLAAGIADRVRPKLRASFAHLDDDALLEHLGRRTD